MEKDITMAHALVLKNRLESLGAQVVLAVSPQQDNSSKVEMTDRVALAKEQRADFYVSLHCNSIDANANGLKPMGPRSIIMKTTPSCWRIPSWKR